MQFFIETDVEKRRQLRRQFLDLRQSVTQSRPEVQALISSVLQHWLAGRQGSCAGVYSPFRGEPDIRPGVAAAGLSLAYPVVDDKLGGKMHYLRVTQSTLFVSGAYGIEEPQTGETVVPAVIFSPCVAVTPAGFRLGNGGGFFDRYLAELKRKGGCPITVAVAYDELVTNAFVPKIHDVPFDWIATESGVRRSGHA